MLTSFRRVSFASFLLLFIYTAAYAQGTKNPGPAEVPVDQEQYVSYWTMEANWHSELQLRNNSPSVDLTVTPSLRAADGSETPLTPVTIKPQEVVSVPLHEALARVGSHPASEYGSVVLRYKAASFRVLYVALMVHREARSIAFHIDGVGQMEGERDFLRQGVWWLPNDKVSDYLIVSNQGDGLMPVKLTLYDAHGQSYEKTLSLAARQTARYSVRQLLEAGGLSGSYGGIEVHALAHARALDTLHFIFDEDAGFGAMLKMFDHDPAAKIEERDFAKQSAWVLRAPMLALAHPDPALALPAGTVLRPRLLVRNTTGASVSASIVFNWKSAAHTGQAVGSTLVLAAHETKRVDVSTLPASQRPPDDANWAAVIVTTTSKPDELVAVAESYDASLRYGAQTPFSDQLASRWEGGAWQADALHDSITTVGNGTAKATKAGFTLFYNQGSDHYDLEQTLAPNEQMWVDIGALIHTGRRDIHGKVLPANLTTGSYQFRDLTSPVVGTLFEGKVIYDLTNGHVAYGCAVCCSYGAYLIYDPFGVGLSSSFSNGVMIKDNCGDPAEVDSEGFQNWSTLNTAVAKTTLAGLHTGMSIGSTASSTSGEVLFSNGRQGCSEHTVTPNGPTNVALPTIQVNVSGQKSAGDNITFDPPTCTQSLGQESCSGFWGYNVEVSSTVPDVVTNWTFSQSLVSNFQRGMKKNITTGVLTPFSGSVSNGPDNPDATNIQQIAGTKVMYYIDDPGALRQYDANDVVDSITLVFNFNSQVCSAASSSTCSSAAWYVKIQVDAGGVLNTSKSSAGSGSQSINF